MNRKRWILAGLVFVVVLLITAVWFIFARLNAPHQGIVEAGSTVPQSQSFDMTPTKATGTYALFNYPTGLDTTPNNPNVGPVIEQFNFMHRDIQSWKLAIAVMRNPGGSISTNNAYQFRKSKPNIYKESKEIIGGQTVVIMTDTSMSGFSKVAFFEHGTLNATVSLYGDDPAGTQMLADAFEMVITSWQWK